MKKILAIILSLICIVGLAACGGGQPKEAEKSELGEAVLAAFQAEDKVTVNYGQKTPISCVSTGDNCYVYVEKIKNTNGDKEFYDYSVGFIFASEGGANIQNGEGEKQLTDLYLYCEYTFNKDGAYNNGNIVTRKLTVYYQEAASSSSSLVYGSGDALGFSWTVVNHEPDTFTLKKSLGESIKTPLKTASANAIAKAKLFFESKGVSNIW